MKPSKLELRVLKARQTIGEFYIASLAAEDLVGISYADVRRLAEDKRDVEKYLGIQRPLSLKRVNEIKRYVTGPDATFPTAVILAIDERCAEFKPDPGSETSGVLTLTPFVPESDSDDQPIPYEKIAKVLDGQHRIAAFLDDQKHFEFVRTAPTFDINLAIFVGADISEQANIFATVNLAQTKVNKSLVYDLTELAESRSPHKTCHNVAVALDGEKTSPLFERIKRLGTATPGREFEPLTQAAFVEASVRFLSSDPLADRNKLLEGKSLKRVEGDDLRKHPFRNLFIEKREADIAEILYNYFKAVQGKWPQSWDATKESRNLLPKSNAFKALMKFLKEDVYLDIVKDNVGRVPKTREFAPYFEPISLKDSDFISQNFLPGSGGQSTFLKMLRREISRDDLIQTV